MGGSGWARVCGPSYPAPPAAAGFWLMTRPRLGYSCWQIHPTGEARPMTRTRFAAGVGLLAALAVLSAGGVRSQDKDQKAATSGRAAPKGQLPLPWSKLDLTDVQKAEIFKLNAEY